jgi:hypothetical protein
LQSYFDPNCCVILLGVFHNSADDLADGEDVYEAIGGLLHDVAADRSEAEIK